MNIPMNIPWYVHSQLSGMTDMVFGYGRRRRSLPLHSFLVLRSFRRNAEEGKKQKKDPFNPLFFITYKI